MTPSVPFTVAAAQLGASPHPGWRSLPIALIGAGAAGSALARACAAAGGTISAVWSRTPGRAAALCDELRSAAASTDATDAARSASIVVLAVPDAAIGGVAASIPWRPEQIAVHLAGALGPEVLHAATRAGAATVAFHPLGAFARAGAGSVPTGTRFGYTGPVALQPLFAEMAAALGGLLLLVPAEGRTLYHAAAVLASNDLVTLVAAAADVLVAAGIGRADALGALLPLVHGTVQNLAAVGLPGALTGPLVRGDLATVRRHEDALRGSPVAGLYAALAAATAIVALQRDDLPAATRASLDVLVRREAGLE